MTVTHTTSHYTPSLTLPTLFTLCVGASEIIGGHILTSSMGNLKKKTECIAYTEAN